METRANYALIGLFTLAVIAASFLFVYWVSSPGRSGSQQSYKIIFTGSVSGLSRGGWVMFNGVRVGEVKDINLVPQDPQHVYAIINIDSRVPIRADTKAHLESTGFTGVSTVALAGGSPDAAPLPKNPDGGPAIIYAQRSDFQDVLESARRIAGQASDLLDKGNKLLDSTSGPLTNSAKNIQKFSDALAANSDGIKNFTSAMADIGKAVGPLSTKLSKLSDDTDAVVKAVDPNQVKGIVNNTESLSAKLNATADKVDGVLTNLNGFLATKDSKGAFGEVADAAKSIHKLADDLDVSTKELMANLNHFSTTGLRQYEALAIDGRKTLSQINQAVQSIEENPQQFIFGKKKVIPEISSSR